MSHICPPPDGEPFTDWIGKLVLLRRQVRASGREEALVRQAVAKGIADMENAGITHIGDISQTGLSIEPLLNSRLDGVVYIEIIGNDRESALATFERARAIINQYRPHLRPGLRIGLTPHAPYSTHPDAFRAATDFCLTENVPMCIHAAESPYENEALLHGRGPFVEMSRHIGVEAPPPPGSTTIHYLNQLGVLAARPLLVHMIHVSDEELDLVAQTGAKIAHCPRSNQLLQCGRMPLEKMLARGIPVALGTDSLGSSPSLDIHEEAAAATRIHNGRVAVETMSALLTNANILD
ncbi:MAG: amidohydrolase family protein [Anaerolineales bacterium]|nr:amidohydrolase family protein [Anaerolineales bacterium]MCB8953305.1 amidohydrolase family protein [Ardenticatenales bacterium]